MMPTLKWLLSAEAGAEAGTELAMAEDAAEEPQAVSETAIMAAIAEAIIFFIILSPLGIALFVGTGFLLIGWIKQKALPLCVVNTQGQD